MNGRQIACRDEARRATVREKGLNGLDYLEVGPDQRTLKVYFLGKAPGNLRQENLLIEGGQRIRDIRVIDLKFERHKDPAIDDWALVTVDRPGDYSTYGFRVAALDAEGRPTDGPPDGFDPHYDRLSFSFKIDCPSDLDCKPREACPPSVGPIPEINYLAKDYASFRQLILDRLAVVMPGWKERHVPDLGIALVEVLAYVGDHLSYYQDAVATEAYLDTARQRISVRRHARLVDYAMHDGVNARTWLTLQVDSGLKFPPDGFDTDDFYFVTGWEGEPTTGNVLEERQLPGDVAHEVFEPVFASPGPIELYEAHNEIRLYTWGNRQCCLPRGSTSATLRDPADSPGNAYGGRDKPDQTGGVVWGPRGRGGSGRAGRAVRSTQWPPLPRVKAEPVADTEEPGPGLRLEPGDVLVLEEVKGPRTGHPGDADPSHRHAVRLTNVEQRVDPVTGQTVVEVEWDLRDALPFPLCVSAVGRAPDCELIEDISVARGNVLLVDHGRRIDERLDPVPEVVREYACEGECDPVEVDSRAPRYRPSLDRVPLTHSEPYDATLPACASLDQDPRRALPWIRLVSGTVDARGTFESEVPWVPRRDLLRSEGKDRHFVTEIDNDGHARLRFGDGVLGEAPPVRFKQSRREADDASPAHTQEPGFKATYRIGVGPDGNVGFDTIKHMVVRGDNVVDGHVRVRNPLPARGGIAPESVADVKRLAPHAPRTELRRAITPDDYARIAERHPGVARAAARLRWSGCSYKVQVAIDPRGRTVADPALLREVGSLLRSYRRLGHEVILGPARQVGLDIELLVCVLQGYQRAHVEETLLDILGNRCLSDGTKAFFHPDRLSFGEGVYLSTLLAAAQSVAGVESVSAVRFHRLFEPPNGEIESGVLPLGPFEIARLDNDPSFPENGRLLLDVRGGR